jgi:methionine sulfoxide reductase heme-binding subunit
MHLTANPIDWYAARAGGIVAYVLLTAVVVLGLSLSIKRSLKRWPRFAVEDVHRFGGLLTGTFIAVHVAAIAIDAYLPFSLLSLAVPFVSTYRPLWVGLGIVTTELLIAIAVTNRIRGRIPHRTWRRVHYLTFAVWAGATVHAVGAGTDRRTPWLLAIEIAAVGAVSGLTAWRVLGARGVRPARSRLVGAIVAVALAAAVPAFTLADVGVKHRRPWNAAHFTDRLDGQVVRQNGVTRGIISLAGSGSGRQRVLVRADLLISPSTLLATSFQMEYLPSGATCRGTVTRIHPDGLGFDSRCRMPNGAGRSVTARWQAGQGTTLQGGVLTAHPV